MENSRAVALVGKAGFQSHLRQGQVGIGEPLANPPDAQFLLVLARSAATEAAEGASQVDGMDSSFGRQPVEGQSLAEAVAQQGLDAGRQREAASRP
jgi:hypothetical protein